jgi:hypothetical protein
MNRCEIKSEHISMVLSIAAITFAFLSLLKPEIMGAAVVMEIGAIPFALTNILTERLAIKSQ